MKPEIIFLYEDSGNPRQFGLHLLMCAAVADDSEPPHQLQQRLECRPLNGDSRLLAACRRADRIARHGEIVVAVFDNDQVRELLNLPGVSDDEVRQTIAKLVPAGTRLQVFLLDRNLESVIAAAEMCDHTIDQAQIASALKKDTAARDQVLKHAAFRKNVRDCILQRVPSFKAIVEWTKAQVVLKTLNSSLL